jgi:2-dehydro-3-deoxygluconokinase
VAAEAQPFDVITVGESLGLLVADRPGRLQSQGVMRLGFGGAESNVAIGVARLGGRSAWAGRLGADAVGALILRELRAEQVTTFARTDEGAATALMLKERPYSGSSRISYYRRGQAGSRLEAEDLPEGAIAAAAVLHLTGISAGLGPATTRAAHAAIDHARRGGAVVSFDVNHRSALWDADDAAAAAYRALAARADIVFAGDDEAELLTGQTDTRGQLDAILAMGPSEAIVKLGARGAAAAAADGWSARRDARRVPVVDTVGAGDAFVAGWLAEMTRGLDRNARLDTAVDCGAFACTVEGDWEAAPTRADLEWLRSDGQDPVSR